MITRNPLRAWLPLTLIGGAALVWPGLDRGWYPHDEGQIGQSALRVLAGELPHRDFTEAYTGGLSLLHAAVFRFTGPDALQLRILLFAVTLVWLPLVFSLGRRVLGEAGAAALALLAVAWSVPLYPAALPSWYNLFFATGAAYSLVRYAESGRRGWLVAAGAACGFSILAKITGLFHLAGVMVAVVLLEQRRRPMASRLQGSAWSALLATGLAGAAVVVLLLLLRSGRLLHPIVLGVPVLAVCLSAAVGELRRVPLAGRALAEQSVLPMALPIVGALLPIAGFIVPYLRAGAIGALRAGVLGLPSERILHASMAPFWFWFVPAVAALALVIALLAAREVPPRRAMGLAAVLLCILTLVALTDWRAYQIAWDMVWHAGPIAIVAGALALASQRAQADVLAHRAHDAAAADVVCLVLLPIAAFAALVQFPFMAPIYGAYVLPLMLLLVAAVWQMHPAVRPGISLAPVGAPMALFAALMLRDHDQQKLGFVYQRLPEAALDNARVPLRVPLEDKRVYERVVALVRTHVGDGRMWAGPDMPEAYFLSGQPNPTRTMYEFFEPTPLDRQVASATRDPSVRVVVLNLAPSFSDTLPTSTRDMLAARFPASELVGHFDVRWIP